MSRKSINKIEIKALEWIQADEVPPRSFPGRNIWGPKLKEFIDSPKNIAFLQASSKTEMETFSGGLRGARKSLGLTGDDLKISQNKEQLRVYVAKRLKSSGENRQSQINKKDE